MMRSDLIEFCAVAPERLWGLAMLSMWDTARGAAELERCVKAGLRGADIWIGPPDELPFSSPHYEPLWVAAEALDVPVNLHINTGISTAWAGAIIENSDTNW